MNMMKGLGGASLAGSILCALICCSPFVVLTVYFGIYSFNNPDKDVWYGTDALSQPALYASLESAKAAKATDVVDMHHRFYVWFLWGFIQMLAPCAAMCLVPLAGMISDMLGSCMGCILGAGACCGSLAWWITGIVWRFRSDGAFVSGDEAPKGITMDDWNAQIEKDHGLYQYSSGKFMYIFYLIGFISISVSCACSLIGCIASCIMGKQ